MTIELTSEKFCEQCKQKLSEPSIIDKVLQKPTYYKFEDGFYCKTCAIGKVQKARDGK